MLSMLRDGGWRRLSRPIDGREFVNETVEQWVLGEPWAGLHFPSWDALYVMLDRSEHGPECKSLLVSLGAPVNGIAADVRPVAAHRRPTNQERKDKGDNVTFSADRDRGNATTYTVRRLKRDNPELAERVINGELSANAAALLAGFRRPSLQIPADDAQRAAEAIRRRLGNDFALALGTLLVSP
jgi:hypothetical protein